MIINYQQLNRVCNYTYLGSMGSLCYLEKARPTFIKTGNLFKTRDLNLHTNYLYDIYCWVLHTDGSIHKKKTWDLWRWLYWRVLSSISWIDHVSKVTVLETLQKETKIIDNFKTQIRIFWTYTERAKYIWPAAANSPGKVLCRKGHARRKISWLKTKNFVSSIYAKVV